MEAAMRRSDASKTLHLGGSPNDVADVECTVYLIPSQPLAPQVQGTAALGLRVEDLQLVQRADAEQGTGHGYFSQR
jgi:hypothetical protein